MKRLLDDLATYFDLDHWVRGVRLAELIERFDVNLDQGSLPRWGTPGPADQVESVSPGPVYLYYVPHLFPGMDDKLRLAHQLQYHLLPTEVPADAPVSVAAVLESFCHLSGDLFGWKTTADGEFLIWIVDLSGHGLETGLACAVVKAIIDNLDDRDGVELLVGGLNEALNRCKRPADRSLYATGFFMKLAADGTAHYCSAGHPPAILTGPDRGLCELRSTSVPVGMFPGQRYVTETFRFEPGETLLFYTDGLIELTTHAGEQFGFPRLRDFVSGTRRDPKALTSALYQELARDHDLAKLDDDVTFVAARMLDR